VLVAVDAGEQVVADGAAGVVDNEPLPRRKFLARVIDGVA
jgi:hypothetical protein